MNQIADFIRKPIIKIVTRAVLYGLTALLGALAIDKAEAVGPAAAIGEGLGTVATLVVAGLIDKWHNKKDRAG